jgi:adenylate cyclase
MKARSVGARGARIQLEAPEARTIRPAQGVRFGVALRLGEVLYGNINSSKRLDFTCIGPVENNPQPT